MPVQSASTTRIAEAVRVTPQMFNEEIVPKAKPVVMRGLIANWPAVAEGRRSTEAAADYFTRLDRGAGVNAMFGPPGIRGKFFYNQDLSGFNFQRRPVKLKAALDLLVEYGLEESPPALAIQSVPVREALADFERDNRMPLVPASVEPRVWIGNAATVATHQDPSENIACCVAGQRRFTLFPPDQVANLYMGPLELTPAGPAISMVDLDEPDLERFPNFGSALGTAMTAELDPGDALYIPYLWWHHVRATEPLNVLVNYWWTPSDSRRGRPMDALMHAMLAIRDLPPPHRDAWRTLFEHYVFEQNGPAAAHLAPSRRGVMGELDPPTIRSLRAALAQTLSKP